MSSFEQAFGKNPQASQDSSFHSRQLPATEFASEHCLLVVEPAGAETVYPVRSQMIIGSGAGSSIVLQDPELAQRHVVVDTDGTKFWFNIVEQDKPVQVNGESQTQGWLKGGEEIRLGGSGLYFFTPQPTPSQPAVAAIGTSDPFSAPESSAPRITAPLEFGNFDMRSADVENDLLAAASVLDEAPVNIAPVKKKSASPVGMFLFLGIYLLQGAAIWIGYELFSLNHLSPAVAKVKDNNSTTKAFEHIVKIGALAQKNEWRKADVQLRQAMADTSDKHAMFGILKTRATEISSEVKQLNAYEKAKRAVQNDKWVRALSLIARIPSDRHAYSFGKKLRAQIFTSKVKPLLSTIGLQISARKFDGARNNIDRALAYDPNLTAAVDLQQRLDKADPEGAKKANEEAKKKFGAGFALFRKGQFKEAVAYFKKLEGTSAGLVKRKAASYQRRASSFVDVLNRGLRASRQGNHGRAVALLLRAHSISRAMGGSKGKYARSLSRSIYQRGKSAAGRKNYGKAMRQYKRSLSFSSYGPARSAMARLKRKARSLYKQALVLKGVDNREARKLLRQVTSIMPSSSSLYRKARRNMR